MNRLLLIFSLSLVVFFAQSCLVDDDKKAIRVCFEHYQTGLINGDATAAVFCSDSRSKMYFEQIRKHVLSSDSITVARLSLIDRMLVFGLRTSATLQDMESGREDIALISAVQHGLINKSSVNGAVIREIKVQGDSALLAVSDAEGRNMHNFRFRKDRDDWKLDMVATFAETEAQLKNMVSKSGVKEDDMIRGYIEQSTGKMAGQEVWLPMK